MVLTPVPLKSKKEKKVMIFSSRGIGARQRYMMKDMQRMFPHSVTEPKLDSKSRITAVSEICQSRGCTGCVFFEVRKRTDLYVWMSLSPTGPTAKFQVYNIHTMEELQLTGNHMLNSRPIITFDASFDLLPHLSVLKELFTQLFAPPSRHPKLIPYVDHVYSFFYADEKIWFRHYQVFPVSLPSLSVAVVVFSPDRRKGCRPDVGPFGHFYC
jgi:ribosome biogenesis protein BRX1